jgi:peptide/nickel transport system permease protein
MARVALRQTSIVGGRFGRASRGVQKALPLYVAVLILVTFVVIAVAAPQLAPYSPTRVNLEESLQPPVWQGGTAAHLLGTDKLGRDILSRLMYGARVSLSVAAVSIGIAGSLGMLLGMLAGYYRGWVETVIMRVVDIKLSLPTILLALLFAVIWGPSLNSLLVLVMLTLWVVYARQAHAETLTITEREYIVAARTIGASTFRILIRHIMPNLLNSMVILATLQVAQVVLMEAALSFLGVGLPPPTPAWGLMIAEGRELLQKAWWVSTMPGIAMALVIISSNVLGDWFRDFSDPTLRHIGT